MNFGRLGKTLIKEELRRNAIMGRLELNKELTIVIRSVTIARRGTFN